MTATTTRARTIWLALAVAGLVAGLAAGLALNPPAAGAAKQGKKAAKKGKKGKKKKSSNKVRTFSTGDVNRPIPEATLTGPGVLNMPVVAGKKVKGKEIADVNVNIRLSGADAGDIFARLTAPNGATTILIFDGSTEGTSWGSGPAGCAGSFLTIDDESPFFLSGPDPDEPDALIPPYAGRAFPQGYALNIMDGGPARGTYNLELSDVDGGDASSTLHCAQVVVKPRNRLP